MTLPSIQLTLDSPTSQYRPGDRLVGRFLLDALPATPVRAVELSVLWYTAGKGDEDLAIHYFDRIVEESGRPLDLRVPHRFESILPASPLSYDGIIVKVCWCVRVRAFVAQGQEALTEVPFFLGRAAAIGTPNGAEHEASD